MPFSKYFLSYFVAVCLSISILSCKTNKEDDETMSETTQVQAYEPTAKDIEGINYVEYVLSDTAEDATKDWLKFQELSTQIEVLKKADLSFFKDDKAILLGFITDLKNEIPEKLNESPIVVRLIALETTIYKLEGTATLHDVQKEALLESIEDVLISHTNLIFQINKKLEKEAQKIEKPN